MTPHSTQLKDTLEELAASPDFANLRGFPATRIALKYATAENFMRKNVYGAFTEPFLHREAANKFREATAWLRRECPDWSFIVFDALRPRSVQRILWAHVVGTPQEAYVANPDRGGMHNFGCAIDLSLLDELGQEVDMGTAFDTFTTLSEPKKEDEHLSKGVLTRRQIGNRLILREAMTAAGFNQLPHEWWHFDAFPSEEVRGRFRIIE